MPPVPGSAASFNPARKLRGLARRLSTRTRDWWRGETDETYFDLGNLSRVNAVLAASGVAPLAADPVQAEAGVAGACRFVLGMLASSPHLRRRFPRALSDGPAGGFAAWLSKLVFPAAAVNVRAAFEAEPGLRVRRVFELREDLRGVFPLGLTPKQRGEYLGWLVSRYGRNDFDLSPEAALWFLFELDEDPARGLAASYRLHPAWQAAVPHGLTRFGWDDLKRWVGVTYGFDSRWLRRAALTEQFGPWDELRLLFAARPEVERTFPSAAAEAGDAAAVRRWVTGRSDLPAIDRGWFDRLAEEVHAGVPARPGVNVIGLFRYTSGLQQAVRSCVDSLGRIGVRTALRDYPVLFLREPRNKAAFDALELYDVTILNTGLDTPVADAYRKSGLHQRPGVYRIGIWWWETEQLPAAWAGRGDEVDEIWAPTRFIAGAMRAAFRKPVFTMLPGLELPPFDALPRSYFGLSSDRFVFSFVFDMNSRIQRKNPLGLIRAFRQAFRRDEPADLVIKVSPPESFYREQWDELRSAVDDAGVTLIDRVLTRSELLGFLNASDCYVSLHRSEGFGLTCAEAMLLGKPVVATAYSGNLDFMTPGNSYLVDYARVTLDEDIDPYPRGAVWADPDLGHAADQMRRVFDRRGEAAEKGRRAKAEVGEVLSLEAAGRRMADRLASIRRR
jgi:glycosyltransferase involved in cell wall biosynthesis